MVWEGTDFVCWTSHLFHKAGTSRPFLLVQSFGIGKACFCLHFLTWARQHPRELGKGGMCWWSIEKAWKPKGLCAGPGLFRGLKSWARTGIRLSVQLSFFISTGGFLPPFLSLRIFGIKKMNHWTKHIGNVAPSWFCRESAGICTCHR